jgi:hypothetical protein
MRIAWNAFRRNVNVRLRSSVACTDAERQILQQHEWHTARANVERHVQLICQQLVVSLRPLIRAAVVQCVTADIEARFRPKDQPLVLAPDRIRDGADVLTDKLVDVWTTHLRGWFTNAADRGRSLRSAYGDGSVRAAVDAFKQYFLRLSVDELTGAIHQVRKAAVEQAFPKDGWTEATPEDEKEPGRRFPSLLDQARFCKAEALRLAATVRPPVADRSNVRRRAAAEGIARRHEAEELERKYDAEEEEEDRAAGRKKAKTKKKKSKEEREDQRNRDDFEVRDKHYVYLLLDCADDALPKTDKAFRESVFYVGQGVRGRVFDHLMVGNPNVAQSHNMLKDKDKLRTRHIQQLWELGRGPRTAVVYGDLTQLQADVIEACLIHTRDLLPLLPRLDNIASGKLKASGLDQHDDVLQQCGRLLAQGAHAFVRHHLERGGLKEHTVEKGV